jgi:NAD+ synthase (glutamine-hydrolysing)
LPTVARSPSPELRLAIGQVAARSGASEGNLEQHLELVEQATAAGADVIVFGELSLSGYSVTREEMAACAEARCIERLAVAAGESVVVAGAPIAGSAGYTNSAVAIHAGGVAHRQDKIHLPGYPPFDEADRFVPGKDVTPFEVRGWRLAVLVCEDAWHIDLTERLASLDVDVALHMAASAEASEGVLAGNRRGWPLVNAALALLGRRYVAYANQVGEDRGLRFWGGAAVYGPDGGELVALRGEPGLALAVLSRAALDDQRQRLPLGAHPGGDSGPQELG